MRNFAFIVGLMLSLPMMVFGIWTRFDDVTSHHGCGGCQCWSPVISDGQLNDLCSRIIRAPCQSHFQTLTIGSYQFISANDGRCNIQWAPTPTECRNAFIGLAHGRDWNMCAAIRNVWTFGNQRAGAVGMGGACIPAPPMQPFCP